MNPWKYVVCATAFAVGAAGGGVVRAQIQYATGQNVAPIYEGWMRNTDGTIDMWFGYLNRNWEEVLHVPVGSDNNIEPGGPDRGQPTRFVPRRSTGSAVERREQFVFCVRLPKDWDRRQELVWTVTANGRTGRAVGTLRSIYELGNSVIGANRGGGRARWRQPASPREAERGARDNHLRGHRHLDRARERRWTSTRCAGWPGVAECRSNSRRAGARTTRQVGPLSGPRYRQAQAGSFAHTNGRQGSDGRGSGHDGQLQRAGHLRAASGCRRRQLVQYR